jgi:hypothetical protein
MEQLKSSSHQRLLVSSSVCGALTNFVRFFPSFHDSRVECRHFVLIVIWELTSTYLQA